jgi:hypothetical protein
MKRFEGALCCWYHSITVNAIQVFEMYVKDSPTERVKLMMLYAGEDDFELARFDDSICTAVMADI